MAELGKLAGVGSMSSGRPVRLDVFPRGAASSTPSRRCTECDDDFTPSVPNQVTCCAMCARERRDRQGREYRASGRRTANGKPGHRRSGWRHPFLVAADAVERLAGWRGATALQRARRLERIFALLERKQGHRFADLIRWAHGYRAARRAARS